MSDVRPVEKYSSWMLVSEEMRQDSPYLWALVEYRLHPERGRVRRGLGRTTWTSSEGFPLVFDAWWRRALTTVARGLRNGNFARR